MIIPKNLTRELSYLKEKLRKENYWIAKHCKSWVEVQEEIICIEEAIEKLQESAKKIKREDDVNGNKKKGF